MSAVEAVAPTDALTRELAIEQAHVDKVYDHLLVATESARHIAVESRARFTSDRADWQREEDSTALFERDAFAYQAAKRLAVLDAEHEGLVFGRLDLDAEVPRYIGRIGVRDEEYEPLVIDWRAPAAEPFYRATPINPMGVVRRRVLRCRDDKVIGIEDDLLDPSGQDDLVVIGEGALMAALSRARGPQMRDIVATIQAEQDEAIRASYQGVTVISGGPGTGKTVVALHRAAYLLYTHRKRLEKGGVLVVGPSAVFMSYIERVLPGLGEDSVTLRSIGHVAVDVLGFGSERNDEAEAATVKGSTTMSQLLRRLVGEPLADSDEALRLRVSLSGEILTLDAPQLRRMRRRVLAGAKSNQARPAARKALLDALWAKLPTELSELPRDEFEDLVEAQASWRMFLNAWWPMLNPEAVLLRLSNPALLGRLADGLLSADQQRALSTSIAWTRTNQVSQGIEPGSSTKVTQSPDRGWSNSDIPLLDELVQIIGPEPEDDDVEPELFIDAGAGVQELVTTADLLTDRRGEADPDDDPQITFAHILVDESQDITPMQWRMLRRRGPQASWTVVGDPAQSSYPNQAETQAAMQDLIGHAPNRNFRLSTNYRSPAEVFELAAKVIRWVFPEADLPTAVRSVGISPLLLSINPDDLGTQLVAQVRKLLDDVQGSVGIIMAPSMLTQVEEILTADPELAKNADRITAITALQAKGLEFDAVLVISPDDIVAQSPGGLRVLYVALTRPTQRLVTLDLTTGAPAAWRESLESPSTDSA